MLHEKLPGYAQSNHVNGGMNGFCNCDQRKQTSKPNKSTCFVKVLQCLLV